MTERERTIATLKENEAYEGDDSIGALMGSIDCRIELIIMEETQR